ncbi:hypothetical protein D3C84_858190 [compost metagenome]
MAVDVSTKPAALTNDTCQGKPKALPTKVSRTAQTTTCRLPRPKICLRSSHRCEGFVSSPITKRNITTPNSATSIMVWGLLISCSPKGPIISPAAR